MWIQWILSQYTDPNQLQWLFWFPVSVDLCCIKLSLSQLSFIRFALFCLYQVHTLYVWFANKIRVNVCDFICIITSNSSLNSNYRLFSWFFLFFRCFFFFAREIENIYCFVFWNFFALNFFVVVRLLRYDHFASFKRDSYCLDYELYVKKNVCYLCDRALSTFKRN